MKTQDLKALKPGTVVAVVWSRHSRYEGEVPWEATPYYICEVRENGRYTEVKAHEVTRDRDAECHDYEFTLRPVNIYATYDDWKARLAEQNARIKAASEAKAKVEAAQRARLNAAVGRAAERGAEVRGAQYDPTRVVMTVEALEALLGE